MHILMFVFGIVTSLSVSLGAYIVAHWTSGISSVNNKNLTKLC